MNTKKTYLQIGVVLFTLLFASSAALAEIQFQNFDLHTAKEQAQDQDKLFFLFFSADWCMPCQWMQAETFQDQRLSDFVDENYLAIKVTMGLGESKILQEQFDVSTIPTILVFSASGQLIDRRETSMEAGRMLRWLRRLDRPSNHLSRILPINENRSTPTALPAPEPNVDFVRPALLPEEPAMLTDAPTNELPANEVVYESAPIVFQARAVQYYAVKLKERPADYQNAVRTVQALERRLDARVELEPSATGQFDIFVGRFSTSREANELLIYLQRHDLDGELVKQ